jgi:hypothetical protein
VLSGGELREALCFLCYLPEGLRSRWLGSIHWTGFLLGSRFSIPDCGTILGSGFQSVRMLAALGSANM